ncbi:PAS domain-containing sensor histidine kinase [Rhizobium straminoryzae]|uniref:histidine kinase n=1 Tax=Rhizobium straminoryzae TaxID=1387186 RepID=A0A549TA77_9HYPH|nr:PAS domain-containing sensor histidine kinase [Rhizobium straminoryzae]TRL38765.1 PAS domain S-box protein [Rhizobium straminoryzae]
MADGQTLRLETDDHYRLLINALTDHAIYMVDPLGYVASWNPGAERVKGYSAHEIIGQHFSTFYTPEDRAAGEPQRGLQAARRDGRFEKEGWRVRKNGERFWANVVIDAIHDDQGMLLGFAKITRDISDKHAAQIQLSQAREELFQAQKMEAIGQLTGGIAHDFNNLLTAILGSLQMLQKRLPPDPQTTPLVTNAIRGAERGAALTQRLLAFARRQELDVRPVDVRDLVEGMVELARRSLPPNVMIDIDCDAGLPAVMTDVNQLETALLNLIVNARDAMPGGGLIRVTARAQEITRCAGKLTPGLYVALCVIDDGEGMDAETLARASTPFFTTKGVGKGTGLGLSMVQGLTEQSGGELRLTSLPGAGTTVTLMMPGLERAAEATMRTEDARTMMQDTPDAGRALTVLAVDDDALVLMNTGMMLEDLGHTVIEAYNGADALAVVESGREIDVVITDHSMPRMTGAELAGRIRQLRPHLPIVLATGYAELPSGEGTHLPRLPKPFTQQQLRELLANLAAPG